MAKVNRPTGTQDITVEIYDIELDENERKALQADPEPFIRNLLGEDHTINGLFVDTRISRGEECPGDYRLVHLLKNGASQHVLQCIPKD